MALLLQSLLAAASIRAFPILINASENETVSPTVPALQSFDHYVVGVSVPDALVLPEPGPAMIEVDGLGWLMVIDSTDDRVSVGTLPANLAGKTGLLVAGEHSRLVPSMVLTLSICVSAIERNCGSYS